MGRRGSSGTQPVTAGLCCRWRRHGRPSSATPWAAAANEVYTPGVPERLLPGLRQRLPELRQQLRGQRPKRPILPAQCAPRLPWHLCSLPGHLIVPTMQPHSSTESSCQQDARCAFLGATDLQPLTLLPSRACACSWQDEAKQGSQAMHVSWLQ